MIAALILTVALGHPVNAAGYILDGSPQRDDAHCVGSTSQQLSCRIARRPECRHRDYLTRAEAQDCFAAETDLFDWPHDAAFSALYCESKGSEDARNGRHVGLFQSDNGNGDAVHDLLDAYYGKYIHEGPGAWASTWGVFCG